MNAENASLLQRLSQRRGVRQFVKFGIVGGSGLIVNLLVFTIAQKLDGHPKEHYYTLFTIGFLSGGVSNYFLNRVWTFRSTGHAGKEGLQFLSVSVLALLVGLATSALVSPVFGKGHITWFVATCAGIVINFFVNKYWTFRNVG